MRLNNLLKPKLKTYDNYNLVVESFENGVATLHIPYEAKIIPVLNAVFDCFSEDSNFEKKINVFFNSKAPLRCIKFLFNGITISVTPNDTKDGILQYYIDQFCFVPRHLRIKSI